MNPRAICNSMFCPPERVCGWSSYVDWMASANLSSADNLLMVFITVSLTIRKGRHQHVFQNGHITKNLGDLKRTDDTSGSSDVGLQVIYPLAIEINRTRCDFINTGDQIHEGGFARSVWADDAPDLPLLEGNRETVHSGQPTETLGQVISFQEFASAIKHGNLAPPTSTDLVIYYENSSLF